MQTKRHSLIESFTNVAIGYLVAVGSQVIIFPFFDINIPISDNFLIGLWFTVIPICRSYVLRRWFTNRTEAQPCPCTSIETNRNEEDDTESIKLLCGIGHCRSVNIGVPFHAVLDITTIDPDNEYMTMVKIELVNRDGSKCKMPYGRGLLMIDRTSL